MPYVNRDGLNRVVDRFSIQQFPGQEFLPDGHIDLIFVETQTEKDAREIVEVDSAFQMTRIQRLIFEIEFNQENRLRILEGRPQVTRAQYRDALITLYKALS